MNNLDWLKENVKIFLDQNINYSTKNYLNKKGYKNVYTVFDIEYYGFNDGKILRRVIQDKMILVTFDKKFAKMAEKYHDGLIICLSWRPNNALCAKSISNKTQSILLEKFQDIKNYYSQVEVIA